MAMPSGLVAAASANWVTICSGFQSDHTYSILQPVSFSAAAAPLWVLAHMFAQRHPESMRRAGFEGAGPVLGEQLFQAILRRHSGVVFSVDEPASSWDRLGTKDRKIHAAIPLLLDELAGLGSDSGDRDPDYPFVLSAGERRAFTANTIYRDPEWRKRDYDGALRISPDDADKLGLNDGGHATITTRRGSARVAEAIRADEERVAGKG